MEKRENQKKSIFGCIVWAVFALYCGLSLFSVARFCLMNPPAQAAPGGIFGNFDRMSLAMKEGMPFMVHGASWFYTCLLRGARFLFGSAPYVGLAVQGTLFLACMAFLYVGMRTCAGALPAAVSTAAFVLFPLSKEYVFSLTPGLFFLALYLFGFCLTGILYRSFDRPDAPQTFPKDYLFSLFVGLFIGFLAYLDLGGILLLLFLAALFSVDRKQRKQAFLTNLTALAGVAFGFFYAASSVVLSVGSLIKGENFSEDLGNLGRQLAMFYAERTDFWVSDAPAAFGVFGATPIASALLILLAFLNVPAVFVKKKSQAGVFVWHLFLTNVLFFSGATGLNRMELSGERGHMMPIVGWCMLAGLGVSGIARNRREMAAEEEDLEEDLEQDLVQDLEQDLGQNLGQALEQDLGQNLGQAAAKGKKHARKQGKTAPGEPLHNPLPVPKKKKRPKADFDHEIVDSDMDFDVGVADGDDFDV